MQQKTKASSVVFISPEETEQRAIVIRPPELPVYSPPLETQITINVARLVGRPIKQSRIKSRIGLNYGRIYAVEYEAWLDPDPVIPVPLRINYTPRFTKAMQQFAFHQMTWGRYGLQAEWYQIAEILACRVMAAAHRLNLLSGEVEAIRDILWYAIATPAQEDG